MIVIFSSIIISTKSASLQNIIFHTQHNSKIHTTSDQGHFVAISKGLEDIITHPLGSGVGSAGPGSIYNISGAKISENYFIQIGQETGLIGLAMFVYINILIGYKLCVGRSDLLSLCLVVSLVGLTIVNMLSHAWTDVTISYIWWGLAGIAMIRPSFKRIK